VEITPTCEADRQAFRQKYRIQTGQRLIGMAARMATEKGVEYLAEALPLVLEKHPQARVLFVGPYQNVVGEEQYARHLMPLLDKLNDHWTFLGVVSPEEMSAFFHESEVTVLPSINSTESYGIVQVESMTCGTPVVATDLPGVRVPVMETGMGRIVPPANAPAIAQALIDILDNPAAYRGHPERVVQLSTPEAVADQYEVIFKSLIA
jgi:glycosyltransferase involved in cell wall biosynthesis